MFNGEKVQKEFAVITLLMHAREIFYLDWISSHCFKTCNNMPFTKRDLKEIRPRENYLAGKNNDMMISIFSNCTLVFLS